MKKNKAKDGIVVNAGNGNYIPNIVRGGAAIPIGKKNFYYMQGRKHEQGGIDVGRNAKTGLEVEGEEVMQVTPNEVRVYSSVPFLRGVSPAELVLNGVDANKVFAAQEKYKDNNRINDDGTKYKYGGDNRQSTDSINKNTNTFNPNDFAFRSINTLDKVKSVEFKNGNYANYVEIPFNKMDTIVAKTLGNGNNLELNKYIIRGFANSLTRNPLKFIDGLQKSVNENVMKALIKSGTKSKNNIIITDYGKKEFGGNTNNKNKMGKLVSINGNVKNGLIHTPNQDRIVTPLINSKSVTKAERNTNIRGRINNEYDSVEKLLNRVRELGTDAQYKSNKDYIPYSSPVDNYGEKTFRNNITLDRLNRFGITPNTYGNGERTISNTSINNNQDIIENINNETPRKGTNQSSSSSTGGVNNRTSKSAKPTIQRVNKLAPATNAEIAGIRRGLEPLLQNTIVDKLNKTVDNDLNVMPVQDDVAKTRNMDNILLGVNLGSSVLDAVMGNIYANQMHGYTAPNITAPTIENPGEIKLNEEDLKDIPAPILMAAAKLKTRYNANPQLSKIEDDTRRIMGEIGRNTSNSRVALARKQHAALQGQQAKNEVYGRKENIETELINKDKLNQQEVTARNLARYDQYNQALAAQRANRARLRLAADTANIQNKLAVSTANAQLKSQADRFNTANKINQLVHQANIDAAKAEARSNIFSGMLGNIGSALNTWNRNKRQAKLDEETLRVLGLRAPNANKLVLSALGY